MLGSMLLLENRNMVAGTTADSLTNLNFKESISTNKVGLVSDGRTAADDDQEFTISLTDAQGIVTVFVQPTCGSAKERKQLLTPIGLINAS